MCLGLFRLNPPTSEELPFNQAHEIVSHILDNKSMRMRNYKMTKHSCVIFKDVKTEELASQKASGKSDVRANEELYLVCRCKKDVSRSLTKGVFE